LCLDAVVPVIAEFDTPESVRSLDVELKEEFTRYRLAWRCRRAMRLVPVVVGAFDES